MGERRGEGAGEGKAGGYGFLPRVLGAHVVMNEKIAKLPWDASWEYHIDIRHKRYKKLYSPHCLK